jgi:hypothetical protein
VVSGDLGGGRHEFLQSSLNYANCLETTACLIVSVAASIYLSGTEANESKVAEGGVIAPGGILAMDPEQTGRLN